MVPKDGNTGETASGTSRPRTKRGRGAKRTMTEWENAINASGGSVKGTARTLDISPREVRRRRDENPALAALFKQAVEDMNDRCEGNLVRAIADPSHKSHIFASLCWLNAKARDRGWGKPDRPTDAPRYDREERDSIVHRWISDPNVQSATNSVLASMASVPVETPMDKEKTN